MAHIGSVYRIPMPPNWADPQKEDLFGCNKCNVEFSLSSEGVTGKTVFCPLCKRELKAWRKGWEPQRC